jgi:hypothetical protein
MEHKVDMEHEADTENKAETGVDRSRLTLLLGLSSTAAAAGCGGTRKANTGYATFDRRNADAFDDEPMGGEGGEGGGSSH